MGREKRKEDNAIPFVRRSFEQSVFPERSVYFVQNKKQLYSSQLSMSNDL